ncbi:MAG: bifunctional oligoribonuclease/PAP phosphatase NrnA, partial [Bacteroidetes bacterium]|nr:bifunctional oligoribonuclease/PAP phosphatase NrnA [Bacteroidota bacterium]
MRIEPDINNLKGWFSMPRDIVIFSHRNPDGDALGSSLALKYYFSSRGHSVTICLPSEFPANFEWLPGADEILV